MTEQIEYASIYCMVNDEMACLEGLARLDESDFQTDLASQAFKVIKNLSEEGLAIDETILKANIKSTSFDKKYNSFIKNVDTDTINHSQYFDELKTYSKQNKAKILLKEAYEDLTQESPNVDDIIKDTQSQLTTLIVDRKRLTFTSFEVEVKKIKETLENPDLIEESIVKTGFKTIDDKLQIANSDFVIVAARPSMGKTAFVLHLIKETALLNDNDILFFSVEMPKHQLAQRLVSTITEIPLWKIKKSSFSEKDWQAFNKQKKILESGKMHIQINDDAGMDASTLAALARKEFAKNKNIKAIFVDYIQLMQQTDDLVIETTKISRNLKQLARDLGVPVIAISQLSRKLESREDKRPMLSDLRDSGCLSGDTKILLANGGHTTIKELHDNFMPTKILTMDNDLKLKEGIITNSFVTGNKNLFEITLNSGRKIKATDNHKFYTINGWEVLGNLRVGNKIAVPRDINIEKGLLEIDINKLILIAHIIADGSSATTIRYSTASEENLAAVKTAAINLDSKINGGWSNKAKSYQLHFSSYDKDNKILEMFKTLGLHNKRAHEKFVPGFIFNLSKEKIAIFLQNIWACDGHFGIHKGNQSIYYSTTSYKLALDIQELLVRIGILSRINTAKKAGYRDCYSIVIYGCINQKKFLSLLDENGLKGKEIKRIKKHIDKIKSNVNIDTIPMEIWAYIRQILSMKGISHRKYAELMGKKFNGNAAFRFCPSREYLGKIADIIYDKALKQLSESDIFWDKIKEIKSIGNELVYDVTVNNTHNFIANNIITHNSLEQDADIVLFLYREYQYTHKEEDKNVCEIIIGKQRQGETFSHPCGFIGNIQKFTEIPS